MLVGRYILAVPAIYHIVLQVEVYMSMRSVFVAETQCAPHK